MIRDYHFHVYFDEHSSAAAAALRRRLRQQRQFVVDTGPLRRQPMGPHPLPQFLAVVAPAALEPALRWLMLEHGQLVVLLHPNSGHELLDHTVRAFWLGTPVALDHRRLDLPADSAPR
jgi:aromatic ring-cleaving dioxygenase